MMLINNIETFDKTYIYSVNTEISYNPGKN